MTALHVEAAFRQGDTFPIFGTLSYANGAPFNLAAGAAVTWKLKNAAGAVVLTYTLGAGVVVSDAACGKITITIVPDDSGDLAPGLYQDSLVAIDPAGYVSSQWTGNLKVRPKL